MYHNAIPECTRLPSLANFLFKVVCHKKIDFYLSFLTKVQCTLSPQVLKQKQLGSSRSNGKSRAGFSKEIQLGDTDLLLCMFQACASLLWKLCYHLKNEAEPQTSKSCATLVQANTVPAMHWSKTGQNGLEWESFFPLFFVPVVY